MYSYRALKDFDSVKVNAEIQTTTDRATVAGHPYWVDDYPVCSIQFASWCTQLKSAMPHIKFMPRRHDWCGRDYKTFYAFYVYMDDALYAMGGIAEILTKGVHYLEVDSPNVLNGRAKGGSDMEFRTRTLKITTAIKNAKKYLLPTTTGEILKLTYKNLAGKLSEAPNAMFRKARDVDYDIQSKAKQLYAILKELSANGVTMPEYVTEIIDRERDVEAQRTIINSYQPVFTFVTLGKESATLQDMKPFGKDLDRYEVHGEPRTVAIESLPQYAVEGVSVLSVLDVGTWIQGVGYRHAQNVFYVEKKNDA